MGRKIPVLGLEARVLESIADGGRLGNGGKRCSGWGLAVDHEKKNI